MSGRGRKRPRGGGGGGAPSPPTNPNRSILDPTNAERAHFEALWHRRVAGGKRGDDDDGARGGPPRTTGRPAEEPREADGATKREEERTLLYRRLSIAQIDTLVGWATSHGGTPLHHSDATAKKQRSDDDAGRTLGLSHLPAAPPPPSHVAYVRRRLRRKLGENASVEGRDMEGATAADARHSNIATSAHVAITMAVEEALTAALVPWAVAHVARCRRLERRTRHGETTKQSKGRPRAREDDAPFRAWTLPPAAAVAALAREGSTTAAGVGRREAGEARVGRRAAGRATRASATGERG